MISSLLSHAIAYLEKKKQTALVLAVITFYVLGGVIYSFYLGNTLRYLPDEADYFQLTTNLAFNGKYSLDGDPSQRLSPTRLPMDPGSIPFYWFRCCWIEDYQLFCPGTLPLFGL